MSNGKGLFVQTEVPDGTWTRLPSERSTPTGRLAEPLRGLGGLADVTRAGSDDLDGTPTTRYTGTLPASPDTLALLGFSDEELVQIGTDWQGSVVDVTVWVDGAGRVVGVERSPGPADGDRRAGVGGHDDPTERLHHEHRPGAPADGERGRGPRRAVAPRVRLATDVRGPR